VAGGVLQIGNGTAGSIAATSAAIAMIRCRRRTRLNMTGATMVDRHRLSALLTMEAYRRSEGRELRRVSWDNGGSANVIKVVFLRLP
jgi:hypothetical protein